MLDASNVTLSSCSLLFSRVRIFPVLSPISFTFVAADFSSSCTRIRVTAIQKESAIYFAFVSCIDNYCLGVSSSCLFNEFVRVCVDCDECLYYARKAVFVPQSNNELGFNFFPTTPPLHRHHPLHRVHAFWRCRRYVGVAGSRWFILTVL